MDRSDTPDLPRILPEGDTASARDPRPTNPVPPRDAAPALKRSGTALAAIAIIDAVLAGRDILSPAGCA